MAHARTTGASGRSVYRVKFTDMDTGHNWYVGFYALPKAARAYRSRKTKEMNTEREGTSKKPVTGVVEQARITSWQEIDDRK